MQSQLNTVLKHFVGYIIAVALGATLLAASFWSEWMALGVGLGVLASMPATLVVIASGGRAK